MSPHRKLLLQLAATLPALLLVYGASIGPVARLAAQERISPNTVQTLYAPFFSHWAESNLQYPIHAYLHFWGVSYLPFQVGSERWLTFFPADA